jgi:oxaloacetate decarboxylase alpha subunit
MRRGGTRSRRRATTTRRQLREVGHESRFGAVIEEVTRVRAELGYPIMVTPFPQIVCTQALYNVIGTRVTATSRTRSSATCSLPGRPTTDVDPDIRDRIPSRPRDGDHGRAAATAAGERAAAFAPESPMRSSCCAP